MFAIFFHPDHRIGFAHAGKMLPFYFHLFDTHGVIAADTHHLAGQQLIGGDRIIVHHPPVIELQTVVIGDGDQTVDGAVTGGIKIPQIVKNKAISDSDLQ